MPASPEAAIPSPICRQSHAVPGSCPTFRFSSSKSSDVAAPSPSLERTFADGATPSPEAGIPSPSTVTTSVAGLMASQEVGALPTDLRRLLWTSTFGHLLGSGLLPTGLRLPGMWPARLLLAAGFIWRCTLVSGHCDKFSLCHNGFSSSDCTLKRHYRFKTVEACQNRARKRKPGGGLLKVPNFLRLFRACESYALCPRRPWSR